MMTILIFGAAVTPNGEPSGTLRRRVEAAIDAARDMESAHFIPTGAVGRYGPSEASVMARLLMESGVSPDRIRLEETGTDTLSSVLAIRRMLRESPEPGPVMVATSSWHVLRCRLLLCLSGIAAHPCPAPAADHTIPWLKRLYWRLREVPAIPYDAALILGRRMIGRL
jgi:vancomycin permeability regulator SanA